MSTALLTPVNLANGRVESKNRWRKQILPFTTIDYGGTKVTFDRQYMQDLIRSFKARSHHQVPLQFADDKNTHTNDPERTRGYLKDLELSADGLYGVFELGDKGAEVVGENEDLGVSARILQGYRRRVDGKMFPAAIQHVLATVDPYVPGMKPWQQVDLANDDTVTDTIDLSSEAVMPGTTKKDGEDQKVTVELSQSDYEAFQQMLSDQKAVMALANEEDDTNDPETDDTDDGEDTPPADVDTDPETDSETDDEEDTEDTEEPENTGAGTSDREPAAAELSNAVDDVARSQVLELTNQLRDSEVAREIDGLRRAGLAPAIVDAARPGLEAPPAALELSNGESVDPGRVLREVLHQVIELANTGHAMVDLDMESGIMTGSDSVQERRQQALTAWENEQY